MRKLLALPLMCVLSAAAQAAPAVLCSATTGRVTFVGDSEKASNVVGNPEAILNPAGMAALSAVPPFHWQCIGSAGAWTDVREMTTQEKATLADEWATATTVNHKLAAKAQLDGLTGEHLRALVKVLLDELNILRASYPIPVTSITRSGTTGTITTRWAHGLTGSPQITVHGATLANYNGTVTATVTGTTTLTYTVNGNPTTPAAGSITLYPINGAMAARTLAQAKTAIQGAIDAGTVVE